MSICRGKRRMGDAVGLLKLTWLLGCQRSAVVLGNNTYSVQRALQGNLKMPVSSRFSEQDLLRQLI